MIYPGVTFSPIKRDTPIGKKNLHRIWSMNPVGPSKKSWLEERSGIPLELFNFFSCYLLVTGNALMLWNTFREFYCRNYHESAQLLCRIIDWDFRPDLALIFLMTLLSYPIFFFWKCKRLTRRASLIMIIKCVIVFCLLVAVRIFIPGQWENWY